MKNYFRKHWIFVPNENNESYYCGCSDCICQKTDQEKSRMVDDFARLCKQYLLLSMEEVNELFIEWKGRPLVNCRVTGDETIGFRGFNYMSSDIELFFNNHLM